MDMQDKEFDKVFNSKFEDFEVEPSAMVWDNITSELDGKKAKRSLMPYLSIAASVIILLTAGLLFLQKSKSTKQQVEPTKLTVSRVEPATTAPVKADNEPAVIAQPNTNKFVATVNHSGTINTSPVINNTEPAVKTDNTNTQPEQVKADNQPLLAANETHAVTLNVVPGKETPLAPKTLDLEQQQVIEKPAVMAAVSKPVTAPVKRSGIHSLGGLVNALVATVDKRQDKLIEFSDNDDDDTESSLTGVNLGVIKIKAVTK